jgi:hypothetical protein
MVVADRPDARRTAPLQKEILTRLGGPRAILPFDPPSLAAATPEVSEMRVVFRMRIWGSCRSARMLISQIAETKVAG